MKKCLGCGEMKELTEFHKQEKGRLGRVSRCKVCVSQSIKTGDCRDCGKPISGRATRCRSCASKMKWEQGDNDGLAETMRELWRTGHFVGNSNSTGLYRDAEWLREQYVGNGLSLKVIADKAGCALSTIWTWFRKFGIPCRSRTETMRAAWARGCFNGRNTEKYRLKMSETKKAAWANGDYDDRKPRGPNRKRA